MPRFYNDIVKPSANKAADPVTETKGGKTPPAAPHENPPKDQKKDETGGQ